MSTISGIVALAAYLITQILLLVRMRRGGLLAVALLAWGVGLLAHGGLLSRTLLTADGLDLNLYHALSAIAWLVSALLFFSSLREPQEGLSALVLMLAAVIIALQLLLPDLRPHPVAAGPGLQAHILSSLLAYALLLLAAVQAAIMGYQDWHLHHHQLRGWVRYLPPLTQMERFLFQLIGLGFALLTVALVTGWLYAGDLFAPHQVHKTVLSLAAWLLFGGLLLGHAVAGWRGMTAVRWTLGGFTLLLLGYLGSKFVQEVILGPA